jgi:hypothetical protein
VTAELQFRESICYYGFLENTGWAPRAAIPSVQAGAVVKGTSEQASDLKLGITRVVPKIETKIRHPCCNCDIEKVKHLFNFEHPPLDRFIFQAACHDWNQSEVVFAESHVS